jgi:hypothetical protein
MATAQPARRTAAAAAAELAAAAAAARWSADSEMVRRQRRASEGTYG